VNLNVNLVQEQGRLRRWGQLDLNDDANELCLTAVVECGLLRAVVADETVGVCHKLNKRRQESDREYMRAGLGGRRALDVIAHQRRVRTVVTLAEEIGFADGLVGERSINGRGGQSHTKSYEEAGEKAKEVAHWNFPKRKYNAECGAATTVRMSFSP